MSRAALVLCLVLTPLGVSAQDDDATRARALFDQGITAYDEGDAETAERLFRESIALRRSGSALFNLATLLEREGGDLVEALHLYEEVASMSGVPEEIVSYSRERMADLAPRLAELVRRETPADTGEPATPAPSPGSTLSSGPDLVGPAVLLSLGGAVLIAGVGTGVGTAVLHGDLDRACNGGGDCSRARIDAGRALAVTTDVLIPVGGAVVAAGLIWLIVALSEGGASETVACGGGTCGARWSF